jgi:hypothetical protein
MQLRPWRPKLGTSCYAQVAGEGRIVLLSYHQPSPAMFSLLDRAHLMAQVRGSCCGSWWHASL